MALPAPAARIEVGQQPVGAEIARADDVACPRGGDADAALGPEEAGAPGGDRDLGAGLAGAVGLGTAQRIVLGAGHAGVAVAFVAGDDHHGAHAARGADGLEQVDRAHQIGGEGAQRVAQALQDQRLCRQVEDDLRPCSRDGAAYRVRIADVARSGSSTSSPMRARSNSAGSVVGSSPQPHTAASMRRSQAVSHEPLKPVYAGDEHAAPLPEPRHRSACSSRAGAARNDHVVGLL